MKVEANVLSRQFYKYQKEYEEKALEVLRSGWYVLGKEVESFEKEFAEFIGTKYCVGLASGLDALWIALNTLGIVEGDEVIIQSNAYIACVMAISMNKATPVFVEPDEYYGIDCKKIEEKITDKTKAILAVHLYGQTCNMKKIQEICKKYNLFLVEDCAQSHGATFDGKMSGTFGDISCFSFYPTKNLGAFGDGGAVVTNSTDYAEKIKVFRNYGSNKKYHNKVIGANSRLDEMQAGLLRIKLSHINELNLEREYIAMRYLNEIDNAKVSLPKVQIQAKSVWHQFVVRTSYRDELADYLKNNCIGTQIHYPIPPHLSEAYEHLNYKRGDFPICEKMADEILSLPFYNGITDDEISYVIEKINQF